MKIIEEENIEYLCIIIIVSRKKYILKKLLSLFSRLYYTTMSAPEVHHIVNQKFTHDFII